MKKHENNNNKHYKNAARMNANSLNPQEYCWHPNPKFSTPNDDWRAAQTPHNRRSTIERAENRNKHAGDEKSWIDNKIEQCYRCMQLSIDLPFQNWPMCIGPNSVHRRRYTAATVLELERNIFAAPLENRTNSNRKSYTEYYWCDQQLK